jgi:hypothetical protein
MRRDGVRICGRDTDTNALIRFEFEISICCNF